MLCVFAIVLIRCVGAPPAAVVPEQATIYSQRARSLPPVSLIDAHEPAPPSETGDSLAVAPALPVTVLRPEPETQSAAETEIPMVEAPADEDAVATSEHEVLTFYRQGLDLIDAKRYDEAIAAFRAFLSKAPEHVYADRASYWIAQAYFLSREYGLALTEQNRLLARFPFSMRAPEALYGAALSNLALGQKQVASGLLRDFLRQYPKRPLSETVSRKLAELTNPRG